MPALNARHTRSRLFRSLTIAIALIAGPILPGITRAAETESWSGTWNARNLWRSVELTLQPGTPDRSTFAIGTAGDRSPAVTRTFTIDDTSMTAELEYAGAVVTLNGRISGGIAEGSLKVTRGEALLTEGSWTLERRAPSDLPAAEILNRVRRALRFPGALAAGYTLEESPAPEEGAELPAIPGWAAQVGSRGEIAVSETGDPAILSDGSGFRMNRQPFGWMPVDAHMREKTLLAELLRSGAWMLEGSTLNRTAWITGSGNEKRCTIEITTSDGVVPARVVIDPATWLPESASIAWDSGDRSFRFSGYADRAGTLFPDRILSSYKGRDQEWRTTRVAPGGSPFTVPAREGVAYDRNASPVLEGTQGAGDNGHLFVRPTIGGREVGWFHIDTGAPFMILDAATADSLGLEVVRAMGPRSMRILPEIRIGQLILRNQPVFVMDQSGDSAPESSRRVGTIGGPAFENAIVVFDYSGKTLSVFAPDTFKENGTAWQPLTLERAPVIEASFDGGGPERFYIDTGKSGSVSFLSHTAARSGFHDGRTFEESENLTVEGKSVELVTHLKSFTLGGRRFDNPEVRLKLPGTTNDEIGTIFGIVGREFFLDRSVIFDYARGRIAFTGTKP